MVAMIGMPPATAASKAIVRLFSRASGNNSGPCSQSNALFAVTMSFPALRKPVIISRANGCSAHQLQNDFHFGIITHPLPIIRQHAFRQGNIPLAMEIPHHGMLQVNLAARAAVNAFGMGQQNFRHPAAHGSHSYNRHVESRHNSIR